MKRYILTSLLLLIAIVSHAQQLIQETPDDDGRIYWTTWRDNWFITVGAGYEWRYDPSPKDEFNLSDVAIYDIAIGKWINPFLGFQFKYNQAAIKGYSGYNNIFADSEGNLSGTISTVHLDLMMDLNAVISGYKKDRLYRIVPYVGAGMSIPHRNGYSYVKDYITWGIINSFRVTDALAVKLTIKSSASNYGHFGVEEQYQRERIYPISAVVGVIYKFKNRGYKQPEPKIVERYIEKVVEREVDLEQKNRAGAQIDTVRIEKVVKELFFTGSAILFELNSSKLSKISRVNLSYIATAIKAFPDERKFRVVGYCDVQTGSVEWNEKLSMRRAQAVYDCLVNEFGVDESRLEIDSKGGVDNMFYDDQTLSRVVILQ